ncbi:MAG: type VI secretion system ImpA family N-terminal domain-containing protein [Rhodobacteraceae bacterium]|jgi:type VI secretion system protein ImpA|nr:type VI secretion system ImpA family N-terminal domain-containing protein [Paracoccaceae bacterium]
MAIDWLTDAISEDSPCGPDMVAADDETVVGYYFEAEANLPERYFVPGLRSPGDKVAPGSVFDPKSISHAAEKTTILGILKKTRDIRLLTLLARQQVLAGRMEGFVEGLESIAALLETYPADVHPQDNVDRRSALEELMAQTTVIAPLQYMNLAGSGEVTLRKYNAATGVVEKRQGEEDLNQGALLSELASSSNKPAVDTSFRMIGQALGAIQRMKGACIRGDRPFTLGLNSTVETLTEMQKLILQARPDLQAEIAPAAAAAPAGDDGGDMPPPLPDSAGPAAIAATMPSLAPTVIPSQGAARQALRAIEGYFAQYEQSSAALLLVIQARLLVGKPLIEAIETLLPEDAGKARIDFGAETGFSMSMDRLRLLSAEMASLQAAVPEADPGPPPVITTRAEVAAWLRDVDDYFRKREPASPIPLLLSRAKAYLDKDFGALISEIMPGKAKA